MSLGPEIVRFVGPQAGDRVALTLQGRVLHREGDTLYVLVTLPDGRTGQIAVAATDVSTLKPERLSDEPVSE